MKTILNFKLFFVLVLLFSISACDLVEDDGCSELDLDQAEHVKINCKVTASNSGETRVPIKVRFYKTACGQTDPKPGSTFTYSGIIERPNALTYTSGTPEYELRNSDDYITVELLEDRINAGNYVIVEQQRFFHNQLFPGLNTVYFTMDN
jgi:hypothetical protein